ncbi:hypothetical protein GCM10010210_33980 [Pseudonocardia hydrocarbonoxydans]
MRRTGGTGVVRTDRGARPQTAGPRVSRTDALLPPRSNELKLAYPDLRRNPVRVEVPSHVDMHECA